MKNNIKKTTVFFVMAYSHNITGVSIYEKQILRIFSGIKSVDLVVIRDGCPTTNVERFSNNGITYFHFPKTTTHKTTTLISFLKFAINPCDRMIFFVNYLPGSFMMEALRKVYPHASRCLVVHDIPWLTHCNGNLNTYLDYTQGGISSSYKAKIIKMISYDMNVTFSLSDFVIVLCQDTYHLLNQLYQVSEDKLHLIHNGIVDSYNSMGENTVKSIRNSFNLPLGKYLAVFTGRISLSKGIDRIVSLIEAMDKNELLAKWHIVYAGPDNCHNWLPSYMVDSISSVGCLTNENVLKLLSACNVGIIASRHEQCSYSGIEMLMSDLPILYVPNSFGVDNMFEGIGIPMNESQLFLDKYPALPKRIFSRKKFESCYSYDLMKRNYIRLLNKLLRISK